MAALDVLTPIQAEQALKGVKGLGDQTRIAGLVTAVSKVLDERCGPVVARTVVETFRQTGTILFLKGLPVGGVVTSISEAWSSETPVVVAPGRYVVDVDGPYAQISSWNSAGWAPRVTVTYQGGRYLTTEAVEEPFTTAAGLLLQHHWRRSDGGGSETYGPPLGFLDSGLPSFGFPNAVRDLLVGELLAPALA